MRFFIILALFMGVSIHLPAFDVPLTSVGPYAGAQDEGNVTLYPGGQLTLTGNAWKAAALPEPYTVTGTTILRFGYTPTDTGEIIGIGLVNDLNSLNSDKTFQLGGSQTWGIQGYETDGTVTVEIPIGQHYVGVVTHLALVADDDADGSSNVQFSNVSLVDWPPTLPVFLVAEDADILVAKAAGQLDTMTSTVVGYIQSRTGQALDDSDGYVLDTTLGASIAGQLDYLQSRVDLGHPAFFWTPTNIVGRDALRALSDALIAADGAGFATYDGAAVAGTLQSALRTMNAMYMLDNNG